MQEIANSSKILSKRKPTQKRAFEAQAFLDSVGVSRKVAAFRSKEIIFRQGDPSQNVMYIQKGGVKLSVVNETSKEAVVTVLGRDDFFGERCLAWYAFSYGYSDRDHTHNCTCH